MLTTARYEILLPQTRRLWIEAEVLSMTTGDIRKPNSEGSNILPSKALTGSRFLEIDTCEANATNSLAFHTSVDFVDWSRHHSLCCPVSIAKTMGLDGDWMSSSSVLCTASKEALLKISTQEALYLTYGITNILTDIVIIVLPVAILWSVQIKPSQKRAICSVFVIRIV